jgi:hypothetical protein
MIIGRAFILLLTLRVSMSLALANDGSAEPSPGADAAGWLLRSDGSDDDTQHRDQDWQHFHVALKVRSW